MRSDTAIERKWQQHPPLAATEITFVLSLHHLEVSLEGLLDRHWQHGPHILSPLAATHDNLLAIEVDVLDPQRQAVRDPQPSPIQDHDDDPERARQLLQKAADFVAAEHHRHPDRQAGARHIGERAGLDAEHILVQKEQRTESLILSYADSAHDDRECWVRRGEL